METKKRLLVNCVLIVTIMALLAYLWNDACNEWFNDGARCFFRKDRANDIKELSLCVFEEELMWRLLPISITTAIILMSKNKILRYILTVIFAIIIVCIQITFGYMHFDQAAEPSCIPSLFTQGGTGIILAITYLAALYLTLRSNGIQDKDTTRHKIKPFLKANVVAYCLSSIVHIASNVTMVFTQTF